MNLNGLIGKFAAKMGQPQRFRSLPGELKYSRQAIDNQQYKIMQQFV